MYVDLQVYVNCIVNVLVNEMGVVLGNCVLLCLFNSLMFVVCWFVVMKVGVIVVMIMLLLCVKELGQIFGKGEIGFVLCDVWFVDELCDVVV